MFNLVAAGLANFITWSPAEYGTVTLEYVVNSVRSIRSGHTEQEDQEDATPAGSKDQENVMPAGSKPNRSDDVKSVLSDSPVQPAVSALPDEHSCDCGPAKTSKVW